MESGSNNTIYPHNFKGTTAEDAETWFRHFNNYCAYKQYTNDKAMALFRVVLVDSAVVWYDSLEETTRADWDRLRAAFLQRYTTPEFLKYKRANSLFKHKQECRTVDDYLAYVQKLASQINAGDQMLRFAVINGLRPEIKNHVTMKQPTSWQELVDAARVGEMCATPAQTDNMAVQIELMRDQLNQLAVEKHVAALNEPSRSQSRSSERRVRFSDSDDRQRRRSLSPAWRDSRDNRRDRRSDQRGRFVERHESFDVNRHGGSSSGSGSGDNRYNRCDFRRGSDNMRQQSPYDDYSRSPEKMRFYGYREASPPPLPPNGDRIRLPSGDVAVGVTVEEAEVEIVASEANLVVVSVSAEVRHASLMIKMPVSNAAEVDMLTQICAPR